MIDKYKYKITTFDIVGATIAILYVVIFGGAILIALIKYFLLQG